jgi:hypothetical protein
LRNQKKSKEYYRNNKEKVNERNRLYYQKHKEYWKKRYQLQREKK